MEEMGLVRSDDNSADASQAPDFATKLAQFLDSRKEFTDIADLEEETLPELLFDNGSQKVKSGKQQKLKNITAQFRQKLTQLQKQEDDFNQNVKVIVESDEQQL